MYKAKPGDIILLNRKGKSSSWFSVLQRFFTRKPYTHCAIFLPNVVLEESVISADEVIKILPTESYYNEDGTDIEIYAVTDNIPANVKIDILNSIYKKYSGTYYGFTQLLWFIYRWFMEVFFKRDMRKKKNWFNSGTICSELVYYYFEGLSTYNDRLKNAINLYDKDSVHAGDIADICSNLPEVFQLVLRKKN